MVSLERHQSARLCWNRELRLDRRASRPRSREQGYLPDRGLATALFLSLTLEKPLLLEGEAGVGKTEAAKALAAALGARLIRLQCYEGLDVAHAVYEWNYARQLLHIRAAQEGTVVEAELFGPEFLIRRPLLEAVECDGARRAADRRDRPRRRGVRGLPARGALRLPDHDPRARHDQREAQAARRSSPRTGRASSTTRSSAAASTTGSATRRSSGRSRSSSCACPGVPERLAARGGRVRARAARGSTSRSRPGSPRRSTGRARSPRSARQELDADDGRGDARLGAEVPRGPRSPSATRRSRGCVAEAARSAG